MRFTRGLLVFLVVFALSGSTVSARGPATQDAPAAATGLDTSSAIVVFKQDPLATYDGHLQGYEKTRPDQGRVNPNSAAAKKYLGYLKAEHSDFERWLQRNVPSAKITSDYYTVLDGVAVDLHGNAIGKLAQNADVLTVEYNALYQPTMSQSYKVIDAAGAWGQDNGRAAAGAGIKVGVIDTGIDSTHPFFDPSGFTYPAGFPKCDAADSGNHQADSDCEYVSPKVIVSKVFYNKAHVRGLDAAPVQDHGTHVAGTIAGVTGKTAIVNGVSIGDMSGIAPGAYLGNYNVFPGDVLNARSEDILDAVEAAVDDGMDVINLSLGGSYHGNNDLLAMGLDNAVDAGVVVAVAAGNSGPGPFTLESPGRARNVITVGASTNQHFVGQPVGYPDLSGTTVGAAVGDFDPLPAGTHDLYISGSATALSLACNGLPDATAADEVALVSRGTCSFSTKVRSAISAGYAGLIVANNVAGDPTAMAKDGLGSDGLPAVMISLSDATALLGTVPPTIEVGSSFSEFITPNKDILAGFSGQGPTNVDMAIKPDLTSVGVNVLSSIPCSFAAEGAECGGEGTWAFFQGTSMATPHIAGSAAVLLSLHPDWTPEQVKSALVNTADLVVTNAVQGTPWVGPMAQGGGRENLTSAAGATVSFDPVSASFGKVNASNNVPTSVTLTLTNTSASAQTFSVGIERFSPAAGTLGAVYNAGSVSGGDSRIDVPSTITVPAGGSTDFTVTLNAGQANGDVVQGWITLSSGETEAYHFAYWAEVAP